MVKDGKKRPARSAMRLVLLDAHAILHRAYHALPPFSNSKGEPTGALYGLAAMLIKIIGDLKPDYLAAAYDLPKPTYRHEAYKEYKAGRAKADPELVSQMKHSREIFSAMGIPIYEKEGFEADDILGTIVEQIGKGKRGKAQGTEDTKKLSPSPAKPYALDATPFSVEIIIASGDMDTLQLVDDKKVQVYTMKKGIQDTMLYDEEAVFRRFGFPPELLPDYKGLSGDSSDNIIGIKGIGEKTATALIQKFGTIEEIYKKLKKDKKQFEKAGVKERVVNLLEEGEEEALFSKMLATIRRDAPIVFSLPEKPWRDGVSVEQATGLFTELEFRALPARFREVIAKNGEAEEEGRKNKEEVSTKKEEGIKNKEEGTGKRKEEEPHPTLWCAAPESIPPAELAEISVALWLTNSALTNPTLEDIMNTTGAESFAGAKQKIFAELKEKNLERVWREIERPLIPIVREMERRGIRIDVRYLKELSTEYHAVLSKLEKKIFAEAGGEFNVASPKQLSEILFTKLGLKLKNHKKTGGGALSTKESELVKMKELHPLVPLILEHRELSKLLGTYIDNIPDMVAPDGRLHAKFLQAGTTTGRMASENPNLQNIPIKSELGQRIRHAFIAETGYKLVAFDYSQIELRIAAFLSGDAKLIEIFRRGEDVHTAVASLVFGVSADKVEPEMRRRAKVINFGIIYGMGITALQQNLGASRAEAQQFYDEYFKTFSTLANYLDGLKELAHRQGYTETFFGRRRYFEGLKSKLPFIRAAAERMAINAPIQGTEADIVKLAMSRVNEYLVKENLLEDARLLLQVHDELVYEVKEGLVAKVAPKIKAIMESIIPPKETKGVICKAECSAGDNWGDLTPMRT